MHLSPLDAEGLESVSIANYGDTERPLLVVRPIYGDGMWGGGC